MLWKNEDLTKGVLEAIQAFKPQPIFLALYNTMPFEMAESMGIRVIGELYGDLDYLPDGTTTIKKVHGKVDIQETVAKVVRMVLEGKVRTTDGGEIEVKGSSICLHGDNPQSPEIVQAIRKQFEKNDVKIAPMEKHF